MQNKFFAEIIISTLLYRHVDFISYYNVSFALFMVITCWGRKLAVLVAVWIRDSGLRPHTHVRANSKLAASRAPPKTLTSETRIGQVRLVTLHTRTSLTHLNPSPAGLASQTRTCMGAFRPHSHCQPSRTEPGWFGLEKKPSLWHGSIHTARRTEPNRTGPSLTERVGWLMFVFTRRATGIGCVFV